MALQPEKTSARLLPWGSCSPTISPWLTDLPVMFAGLALFYGLLALARYWTAPVNTQVQIDLRPSALPAYALFSVTRLAVAYFLSLLISLIYGYVAANSCSA